MSPTRLPEVLLIEPRVFGDARGSFFESWSSTRYEAEGITGPFVQDNISRSTRGVLRGLHLQHPNGQGKLVSVIEGEVFDVAVDVRVGSPRFGQWAGASLSGDNHRQLWVPAGFAHGFYVTSEEAIFHYKCTDHYHPETEISVRWDDPAIGIEWPGGSPSLNEKDAGAACLADMAHGRLPHYRNDGPAR